MKKLSKAVALKYQPAADAAPKITAKGKGKVAERIMELAKKHNIPLKRDPDLVEGLSTLDLYEEIPVELYRAVAQIFAFVYKLTKKELPP